MSRIIYLSKTRLFVSYESEWQSKSKWTVDINSIPNKLYSDGVELYSIPTQGMYKNVKQIAENKNSNNY